MATLHICTIVLRNTENDFHIARVGTGYTKEAACDDAFQFTRAEAIEICDSICVATGTAYLKFYDELHQILFNSQDAGSALINLANLPNVVLFTFYNTAE